MKQYMLLVIAMMFSLGIQAQTIEVSVEIPNIDASPYHRPYVAIWVETPQRKGVHTLAFWAEQKDWFKDLRQWWRKIGRSQTPSYDAATGATRKPGTYQLKWDGLLSSGQSIEPGSYVMHIESVREQGSREYLRQSFVVGETQPQHYELNGQTELGNIVISIH